MNFLDLVYRSIQEHERYTGKRPNVLVGNHAFYRALIEQLAPEGPHYAPVSVFGCDCINFHHLSPYFLAPEPAFGLHHSEELEQASTA